MLEARKEEGGNLFNIVPPAQANKKTSSHVFHSPKIKCIQYDGHHSNKDEIWCENSTEDVNQDRQGLEK